MEICVVRHTTPEVGKGICYGQSDVGLTGDFELEASHILVKMPSYAQAIYTSPMQRCTALADFLTRSTDLPIIQDPRLKELNFGDWEMKAWDNMEPSQLMKWMTNYETERCPNGESYTDLVMRVKDFIEDLRRRRHETVIVVTHGGVIKAFHAVLNRVSLAQAMDFKAGYGEVVVMHCL